jgi:hypothetical protein
MFARTVRHFKATPPEIASACKNSKPILLETRSVADEMIKSLVPAER